MELSRYEKKIVFIFFPDLVGYRRNLAADSAAKDALDGDILDVLIFFSDVKPYVKKYLLEFRVLPQQIEEGFPMVKWLYFLPSE